MSDNTNNTTKEENGTTTQTNTTTENQETTQKSAQDRNFENLRKRAEKSEKELEKMRKAQEEGEKAKLEADGKLQELLDKERKEKEELISKYQTQARQSLLEKELQKAGINSELVDMILPSVQSQVDFGEDNTPTNLSSVLDNLKTSKPSLFVDTSTKTTPAGAVGASTTNNASPESMTAEQAVEMVNRGNFSEIQKHDKAIRQALSQ